MGATYLDRRERKPQEEALGPVQVTAVGLDALQDPYVAEILSEVEQHMEGLAHEIDENMVDQLPL